MKKSVFLFNFFLIGSLVMTMGIKVALAAPHISVTPSSKTVKVGDVFDVTFSVDAASKVIFGADVKGTYDSSRLELVYPLVKASKMVFDSANGGQGGDCDLNNSSTVGNYSFGCYQLNALNDLALSGDLVVVKFRAKAVGTATVSYTCTSDTTDTNVIQLSDYKDVITCGENIPGSYVIVAADNPTEEDETEETTTTTTRTTTTTATLPKTGSFETTLGLIVFGVVSFASAFFLRLL